MSNTRLCPNCGAVMEADDRFCPACGTASEPQQPSGGTVYCPACGQKNDAGDRFCMACGSQLDQFDGAPAQPSYDDYDQPEQPRKEKKEKKEKKDKKPLFGKKEKAAKAGEVEDETFRIHGAAGNRSDEGTVRIDDGLDRGPIYGGGTIRDTGMDADAEGEAGNTQRIDDDRPVQPRRSLYTDVAPDPEPERSRGSRSSGGKSAPSGYGKKKGPNKNAVIGVCIGIVALLLIAAVVLFFVTANNPQTPAAPTASPAAPTAAPEQPGMPTFAPAAEPTAVPVTAEPATAEPTAVPVTGEPAPFVPEVATAAPTTEPAPFVPEVATAAPTTEPAPFVPVVATAEPAAPTAEPAGFAPIVATAAPAEQGVAPFVPVVATPEPAATAEPVAAPAVQAGQEMVIITSTANHRIGPGETSGVIGVAEAGEQLPYLGNTVADSNGVNWYNVRRNGADGWVSEQGAYLQSAGVAAPQITSAPSTQLPADCTLAAVTSIGLLDGPGGSSVIESVTGGTELKYMNDSRTDASGLTWHWVTNPASGQQGWVNAQYVQVKN